MRSHALRLAPAVLLLLLSACAPRVVRPTEESVRPGANEPFVSDEVDVERFVEVFEGESREIALHAEEIVAAMELEPGSTVADVGAGTGLFLGPLASAVGPGGRVIAIDISEAFVEHMEVRVRREGLGRVEVKLGLPRSLGLERRVLDAALVCDTYHHFEFPQSMLWSLHRSIRPGGELVVVDFERIPGVSREWVLDHVRAGKETVIREIEDQGFELVEEVEIRGLEENYFLRFRRPEGY